MNTGEIASLPKLGAPYGMGLAIATARSQQTAHEAPPSRSILEAIVGRCRSEKLDADYGFALSDDGFDVSISSPFTQSIPVVQIWGGLFFGQDAVIRSGPISLSPALDGKLVSASLVSFGARVVNLRLKRVPQCDATSRRLKKCRHQGIARLSLGVGEGFRCDSASKRLEVLDEVRLIVERRDRILVFC